MIKNKIKTVRIGRNTAKNLAETSGGRFMTLTFTTKDNRVRKMNCRYVSTTPLGYLKVKETSTNGFKDVNLQTLSKMSLNKKAYTIR